MFGRAICWSTKLCHSSAQHLLRSPVSARAENISICSTSTNTLVYQDVSIPMPLTICVETSSRCCVSCPAEPLITHQIPATPKRDGSALCTRDDGRVGTHPEANWVARIGNRTVAVAAVVVAVKSTTSALRNNVLSLHGKRSSCRAVSVAALRDRETLLRFDSNNNTEMLQM